MENDASATGNDHNLSISSRFEDYLPNDVSSIYPPFKVAEDESPTNVMEPVTFPLPKSISVRSRGYLKMIQDPADYSSGVGASEIRSLTRSSRIASPLNASVRKLTEVEMQKDGSATRNDHNLSIASRFEDYLPNDFSSIYPSFNPHREPARSSLMQYQDPINLTVQCLTRLNDTTREVETLQLEKETFISVNQELQNHLGYLIQASVGKLCLSSSLTTAGDDHNLFLEIESIDRSITEVVTGLGYLWGNAALKLREVEALNQDTNSNCLTDTEAVEEHRRSQFRENLPVDPRICVTTVLHFPYNRIAIDGSVSLNRLKQGHVKDRSERGDTSSEHIQCYDPVFILHLSICSLSTGYIEPAEFAGLGLLAVAFVSMSSTDIGMRKLCYEFLGRYQNALERSQKKKDAMGLNLLLTYLRNGIEESWQRIPSIIALFAAESSFILLDPSHDHNEALRKHLMHSSGVNTKHIPLFHTFFRSNSVNFRAERLWMIRLVCASEIRSLTRSSRIASPLNESEPSMGASNSDQEYERAFEAELLQEVEVSGTPRRDWTTQGIIVPTIRDQHKMNTCWAFVTATSLEYLRKIKHPSENQIAFSAQQLIDCCVPNPAGTIDPVRAHPYKLTRAFPWVKANGIVTREAYPDETMRGDCRCLPEATRYFRNMVELIHFDPEDQNGLSEILDRHPVIGTILVFRGFEHLGPNDIYYGPPVGVPGYRHGVVLMGYETFKGVEVIIFQNSYGVGWGANGIGRFARYKEVNG